MSGAADHSGRVDVRTAPTRFTSNPTDSQADSWGGHAIVLFLAGALGYPVASRLVDGAHLVADSMGRMTIVDGGGRMDTVVGLSFFTCAVAAACLGALARPARRWGSALSLIMQLLVLWWAVLSLLIPRKHPLEASDLVIIGTIPLILGVVSAPPTLTTVRRVNLLRDLFATGQFVYPFFAPDIARVECRPDKCGIFGHLDTGFFTQENTGIAAISLLLPLAAASSARRLAFSSSIAMLVALASGSRTGIISVVVVTGLSCYLRHHLRRSPSGISISPVVTVAPVVATAVSLGLFLFADPSALTGRGAVYAANLAALDGPALLYGVPWDTVPRASDGYLVSDHGQASHILARAGVVGFLLWLGAVLAPLWRRRFSAEQTLGLAVLAGGSTRMLTESTFELEARTVGFGALLIVAGLFAHRGEPHASDVPELRRTDVPALVGSLVAGAVALAVVPTLLPTVYTAQTVVSVSIPVSEPSAGEEGQIARKHTAASVGGVGTSAGWRDWMASRQAQEAGTRLRISVSRSPETTILRLRAVHTDATQATRAADAAAEHLRRNFSTPTPGRDGVRLIVQPAGRSIATETSPWRSHLVAGCASAATASCLSYLALRRRRERSHLRARR